LQAGFHIHIENEPWMTGRYGPSDATEKIIYRDNFQTALLAFVDWYKRTLPSDRALQEGLIRKFDSLLRVTERLL
jgi:hypothetical protein